MDYLREPNIKQGSNPENTFQDAVVQESKKFLEEKKYNGTLSEYFILEKFGLDIAIFTKWSNGHQNGHNLSKELKPSSYFRRIYGQQICNNC